MLRTIASVRAIRLAVAVACLLTPSCNEGVTPTSPSPTSSPDPPPVQTPDPVPAPDPVPSPPTAPPVTFGPGRHRVGSEIPAGRYFTDPEDGCYWERQSGLGGTTAETIAYAFVDFDAGQWIVDLAATDAAFEATPPCATWSSTAQRGLQSSIGPGVWLVGTQIAPGMYTTSATAGCYWERLRDFTGQREGTIASEITSAGTQFVAIGGADAGFRSDAACGTWTRVQVQGETARR